MYDMNSGYSESREAEKTVITEGMILNDGAERIWYDRGTSTKSPRILHYSIHDVHLQIRGHLNSQHPYYDNPCRRIDYTTGTHRATKSLETVLSSGRTLLGRSNNKKPAKNNPNIPRLDSGGKIMAAPYSFGRMSQI